MAIANDDSVRDRVLPAGAVFHRCALQVNPQSYNLQFRGQATTDDVTTHAREVVDKALALGISVLAITDHNDVSAVPAFQAAAGGRLHIFPGFELSSHEGVHVLCLYPPESSQNQLGRYLGEFGITNTNPSSDLSSLAFEDILAKVRDQGGVTVAAHVTAAGGMLKVLKGQPRMSAWQNENLLAIQIPGPVADLPLEFRQIVENNNAAYNRGATAEENLAVAVVNAKDVVHPDDLEHHSATCWVKMSEVSIEGLRQAFLDPGSRLRLNPKKGELEREGHAELLSLAWEGGFLDGVQVDFNANLNVLVGGRGTGKSTIIESIRAVLGLDAVGDEARKAHDGIVRKVLRNGTKVSLHVRAHRPAVRDYYIERTIPNPPLVRDDRGKVSNLAPTDILPRVEVFGQHELSELTKSGEKLTRLLDRFVERDDELVHRKADLQRELEKSRQGIVETRTELQQTEERLAALPGLEETLARFKDAGIEERLKEQDLLVREEQILTSSPERLATLRECLENLQRELPVDRAFLSAKALEALPAKEILGRLNGVFERLESDLAAVTQSLEAALRLVEQGVDDVRVEWEARKQEVQAAYERILRDLQKSRIDGEEFIRLRRQIEGLRPLREAQASLRRLEAEQSDRRRKLLADWEDLKGKSFRQVERAAKAVNRRLKGRVQVEVTATGDRDPLFEILRDDVGGRLAETIETLRGTANLSPMQFVATCRAGAQQVSEAFGSIPAKQAETLAQADTQTLMRIEELDLPTTTVIRLNTAPTGKPPSWQALEELSTGQKATAILLLLLLESDAPLIVDQPEDDLDNRFITEGVVPRMRAEKQQRQFVFSTHNANIPVLGDAELIVGLTAAGEADDGQARIAPEHVGSIDDWQVRELVEEILEGGKDAFERRRRKYGF